MIKIENQLEGNNRMKRSKTKKDKKILKSSNMSDHQDQLDREEILNNDSQAQLNEDEENEGGEGDSEDAKQDEFPGTREPSMQEERSSAAFLKTNSRYSLAYPIERKKMRMCLKAPSQSSK